MGFELRVGARLRVGVGVGVRVRAKARVRAQVRVGVRGSGEDHGVHELRAVLREQRHEGVRTGGAGGRAGVLGRGRVRVRVKG